MRKILLIGLTCLFAFSARAQDSGEFVVHLPKENRHCAMRIGGLMIGAGKRGPDGKRIAFSGTYKQIYFNEKIKLPVGTYQFSVQLPYMGAPVHYRTIEIKKDQLSQVDLVNAKSVIQALTAKYSPHGIVLAIDHTDAEYQKQFLESFFFNFGNRAACRSRPGSCRHFEAAQAADDPARLNGTLLKFPSQCNQSRRDWECYRAVRYDGPQFATTPSGGIPGEVIAPIMVSDRKRCQNEDIFVFPGKYIAAMTLPDFRLYWEYAVTIE